MIVIGNTEIDPQSFFCVIGLTHDFYIQPEFA